jgi:hypothetical protein
MLGIGEYTGRLSMVMRSSGHISLEPTLEGPEYVLQPRQTLHDLKGARMVLPPRLCAKEEVLQADWWERDGNMEKKMETRYTIVADACNKANELLSTGQLVTTKQHPPKDVSPKFCKSFHTSSPWQQV